MSGSKKLDPALTEVLSNAWERLSALLTSVRDLQKRIEKSQYAIVESEKYLRAPVIPFDKSGGIFRAENEQRFAFVKINGHVTCK